MERFEGEEILANFLGAHFHQDMESPEEAIKEYVDVEHYDALYEMVEIGDNFLNSALTIEEKNVFIYVNTEIYFPALGITPLQWFHDIINYMKKHI